MASPQGIRAGKAFIEIGGDDSPLARALDRALGRIRSFSRAIAASGLAAFTIGAGVLTGLAGLAVSAAGAGDELAALAARTGLSIEAIGSLKQAAENSGASIDDVEKGLAKLSRTIIDAADGSTAAVETLEKFGLSLAELQNATPDQRLALVADALSRVEDPARRTALAYELLGKSGTNLIPVLQGGSDALRAQLRDYRELGLAIADAASVRVAGFDDLFADLLRQITGVKNVIGAAAADIFGPLLAASRPAIASLIAFIDNNRAIVGTIIATATAVAGLGAALATAGTAIYASTFALSGLQTALSVLTSPLRLLSSLASLGFTAIGSLIGGIVTLATTAVGLIGGAIGTVFSFVASLAAAVPVIGSMLAVLAPVVLAVAAVAGAATLIYLNFDRIRDAASGLASSARSAFTSIRTTAASVFQSIINAASQAFRFVSDLFGDVAGIIGDAMKGAQDAISGGDFQLAGEIAMTGLKAAFQRGLLAIQTIWFAGKAAIVDFALASYGRIITGFGSMAVAIRRTWNLVSTTIRVVFFTAIDAILARLAGGVQTIFEVVAQLATFAKDYLKIDLVDATTLRVAGDILAAKLRPGQQAIADAIGDMAAESVAIVAFENRILAYTKQIDELRKGLATRFDQEAADALAATEAELARLRDELARLKEDAAEIAAAPKKAFDIPNLKTASDFLDRLKATVGFGTATIFQTIRGTETRGIDRVANATERTARNTGDIAQKIDDALAFA